ncbi:hypothetical protein [Actinoplanes sp. NPDC020271]|uniref:hypothetical protein n=1 Tax=Actinoplanes sp. NPDC020271 TaxID=3363896 RepID=UPI0037BB417F
MDRAGSMVLRADESPGAQLLAASRDRRVLDCRGARVDAAELRAACLDADGADPFGLRLSDARVTGVLDLRACRVNMPLRLHNCEFTDRVRVSDAELYQLEITADRERRLPGLVADGVRIARDLVLSGMTITGDVFSRDDSHLPASVWLTEADISGSIIAHGTRILPEVGRAVNADRIRLGGNIRFTNGFRATGEIRSMGMRLTGSIDLTGAELVPADGRALDLWAGTVGGSVYLLDSRDDGARCRVRGRVELGHTTVQGELFLRNADLIAPPAGDGTHSYDITPSADRIALLAPRLTVRGLLRVEGDTVVHGGILLPGAQLDGGAVLQGAVWNPDDTAVDLTQATLGGGLDAPSVSIEGTVRIDSARIDGPVRLAYATFTRPRDRICLSAVDVTVAGDVRMWELAAVGGKLDFRLASVAGILNAEDAYLANPGDTTISLYMARVTGNVRLCGRFRSVGIVLLNRAVIDGRLRADGATLSWAAPVEPLDPPGQTNRRGAAVEAVFATIRGGIDLGWRVESGAIDLTGTTTSYLADRPDRDWPVDSYLGGFTYDRFEGPVWDARARIAWLARMRDQEPGVWEQLAAVLRASGDQDGAEEVLIAQRRRARRLRTVPRKVFDLLQDVTVRYGFRPQRALYLLLALIAAVTAGLSLPAVQGQMRATDQNALVFSPAGARPLPGEQNPPGACGDGRVRCLSPFFYAVDTVVPLIDLHQRSTWYPVAEGDGVLLAWVLNFCTILGWVASTVFAVSFTRLGRGG